MQLALRLFMFVMIGSSCLAFAQNSQHSIPDWAITHMSDHIGTWITNNSAFMSDAETDDHYGMDWEWTIGNKGMSGRLYGIRDSMETGTYWEYRVYWHPDDQALVLQQFGADGTIGIGTIEHLDDSTTELEQTYYTPTGESYSTGHRISLTNTRQDSRSYSIDSTGTWNESRHYIWHKE